MFLAQELSLLDLGVRTPQLADHIGAPGRVAAAALHRRAQRRGAGGGKGGLQRREGAPVRVGCRLLQVGTSAGRTMAVKG